MQESSSVWEFVTAQDIMVWAKEWQKGVPMSGLDWTAYVANKINERASAVKTRLEEKKNIALAQVQYANKNWKPELSREAIYQSGRLDGFQDAITILERKTLQDKEN